MAEQDRTSTGSRRSVHHCRTTSFSDELEEVASAHTVQRQDQETSRVTVPTWSSPSRIWATNTEGYKLGDEPPDAIGVQNVQWRTSTRSISRQALNGSEQHGPRRRVSEANGTKNDRRHKNGAITNTITRAVELSSVQRQLHAAHASHRTVSTGRVPAAWRTKTTRAAAIRQRLSSDHAKYAGRTTGTRTPSTPSRQSTPRSPILRSTELRRRRRRPASRTRTRRTNGRRGNPRSSTT